MKQTLLKTFYHLGAFAPFQKATRGKILILTYHRFSREKDFYKTSAAEFAAHLAYLKKHHRVLSLSEAADRLENDTPLPPGAAVVTIDDGYADAFEIALPLLRKYDFPATLYAVTDFLDGKLWLWTDLMRYVLGETKRDFLKIEFAGGEPIETNLADAPHRLAVAGSVNSQLKKLPDDEKEMKISEIAESLGVKIPALPTADFAPVSWAQAREMDTGNLRVESHTVTHPILTNIGQARLDDELRASKERLETMLDRPVEHFCYPNGSLNETVWRAAKNGGYRTAVTTDYGFNQAGENLYALNRISAQSAIENFAQSASGFEAWRRERGRK